MTYPKNALILIHLLAALWAKESWNIQAKLVENSTSHAHCHIINVNSAMEPAFHLHSLLMSLRSAKFPSEFLFTWLTNDQFTDPTTFIVTSSMQWKLPLQSLHSPSFWKQMLGPDVQQWFSEAAWSLLQNYEVSEDTHGVWLTSTDE